jgi:5-methylcytosine-specific restriction protein A
MPARPASPCAYDGCPNLSRDGTGRCENHPRSPKDYGKKKWQASDTETPRIKGSRRQKLRRILFDKHPLCILCQIHGRVSLATQRDHITPLSAGGTEDEDNTQGLCEQCHEAKTYQEKHGYIKTGSGSG